jgi:hypothetical protein
MSSRKAWCLRGAALLLLALLAAPARSEEPSNARSVVFGGLAGQRFYTNSHGFSEFAGAFADVGKFISRKLELGLDLHPLMVIRQPNGHPLGTGRETVPAAALDVVLRWFPGPTPLGARWYLEVADGPFWSWHRVPAGGTRFNFLTQAGTGLLFPAGKGWTVLTGYRWVHISNANLGDRNPAWNYHALVLGLRHEIFPGKKTSAGER